MTLSSNSDEPDETEIIRAFKLEQQDHVEYFPHGLDKIFPDLYEVDFWHSGLKEIRQVDLKPFGKLKSILVHNNMIEYIEKDLFKFNPDLVYVNLDYNKISYIDPNVFDNLNSLKWLFLINLSCIDKRSWNDRQDTLNVITEMKGKCSDASKIPTTTDLSTTKVIMTTQSAFGAENLSYDDNKSDFNSRAPSTSLFKKFFIFVFMPLVFLMIIGGACYATAHFKKKRQEEMNW